MTELLERLESLSWRIRPYLLFTSLNTIWHHLDKSSESILDVGCGEGRPMSFLNRRRAFNVVGVDIFEPCLQKCRKSDAYTGLVLADVMKLPFKTGSFDLVLAMEVLEHLDKEAGRELLKSMEKIARRQVILCTPVGRYRQAAIGNNPHQEHKAYWQPAELRHLGYIVRGQGLPGIFGDEGLTNYMPGLLRPLGNLLWVCAGPFVHFFPTLAGDMVAIKDVKNR